MSVLKSRNYSITTIKRLYALSDNQCYCPDCDRAVIASDGKTLVNEICHIEAVSPKGARYNSTMTDEERRYFDNLILLCDEHHKMIDNNPDEYPVSLLNQWKQNHEHKQKTRLLSHPTLLGTAINAIIDSDLDDTTDIDNDISSFDISKKIRYNAIKRNKSLIKYFGESQAKISSIYSELENQGSFKKHKLLRIIKAIYSKQKGKYVLDSPNEIEIVQAHADDIIEDVENAIWDSISKNKTDFQDDISFGVTMVMVDAFMRCKILEEPKK